MLNLRVKGIVMRPAIVRIPPTRLAVEPATFGILV